MLQILLLNIGTKLTFRGKQGVVQLGKDLKTVADLALCNIDAKLAVWGNLAEFHGAELQIVADLAV